MTDDYPIHNAVLNFKTSINRDEAVWTMLRLPRVIPDIIDKCADDIEFSLQANLDFFRDGLVVEYEVAKNKLQDDATENNQDNLAKKLQELKDFDNDIIRQAQFYLCVIDDELAKGSESKLRLNKDGLITINSFNNWHSNLKAAVLVVDGKTISTDNNTSKTGEYTHNEDEIDKKLASIYATLAFALEDLAKLYAEKGGNKDLLHDNGTVNQEKIAEHLCQLAIDYKYDETSNSNGQSVPSLKPRISLAFKVKNNARALVETNQINKSIERKRRK